MANHQVLGKELHWQLILRYSIEQNMELTRGCASEAQALSVWSCSITSLYNRYCSAQRSSSCILHDVSVVRRSTKYRRPEQTQPFPIRQQTFLIVPASPNIAENDKEGMMDKTVIAETKQP